MTLKEFNQHIAHVVLNNHSGRWFSAARELDIGAPMLDVLTTDIGNPSEHPADDARILVDIIREFLPQMTGDDRVAIMEMICDGYCRTCGSDFPCECERGS